MCVEVDLNPLGGSSVEWSNRCLSPYFVAAHQFGTQEESVLKMVQLTGVFTTT